MKALHLVLKGCWYDKIASGEKTSEYREIKPYWNRRFNYRYREFVNNAIKKHRVIFHRGYTNETMEFEIKSIDTTSAPNDLNLDKCWEIKLGNRIK